MDLGSFITDLAAIVGPRHVLSEAGDLAPYQTAARYGGGRALAVVRPDSAEQVAAILRLCHLHKVRLVPQGANTGLVGASVPDGSGEQLVLSLSRLTGLFDLDVANRAVTVGAGWDLDRLNEKLAPHGLWFPIDISASPSVGGMISTNAGGSRVLRYGDARRNVLSLQVVLPDGSIAGDLKGLRKNSTGLDFKQLFIGTGGSFGIVTAAVLDLQPLPKQTVTALVVPRDLDAIGPIQALLDGQAGEFLSAFESMSGPALKAALHHRPQLRNPFGGPPPEETLLVELMSTTGADQLDLEALLLAVLEQGYESGLIADAIPGPPAELWALRHAISEGLRGLGRVIGLDISLARGKMSAFRAEATEWVRANHPGLLICGFGHRGDGGDHFNLVIPKEVDADYPPDRVDGVRRGIYDLLVGRYEGSYSGEHGVGPVNLAHHQIHADPAQQALARLLQNHLDGDGLLGRVRW
ncbi:MULTISPECIES: FAD-binding oxidoreductase [unclassified Azospirillum]|uniref:FAD-binding oxidoreductase n=1 Tax=unclassified Azospirillum TaxID=2630922 RepID=UPI000B68C33F|nr:MULTISPECIES: FAD-binding oxidoreductase [unclassified Azospirillum]SNS68014.1 FAD/FMN-containing dehydrogenase [Azospirillum sp. RU38E]SNS86226.1 FAD/FMN-containing dehydrogenase [Azospirillum sp. RU37A]